MALTPASVLIFRYDNPDALLTLLLVGAAAALLRSLQTDRLRWVILASTLVGLAFLTKYLQAYLVLPAFALTYLVAAPGGIAHRSKGLLVAAVTVVVTSGWWVAIVELIPTADRPFIGGSTTDSALQLLLGYDGLGRIVRWVGCRAGRWRRRWWHRGELQWGRRDPPAVQRRVRRPDQLAPPVRPDRAGRRAVAAAPRRTERPRPRRLHPVGQLARRDRPRLQPDVGHRAHVLRGRARPGHRGPRGRRHGRALAAPSSLLGAAACSWAAPSSPRRSGRRSSLRERPTSPPGSARPSPSAERSGRSSWPCRSGSAHGWVPTDRAWPWHSSRCWPRPPPMPSTRWARHSAAATRAPGPSPSGPRQPDGRRAGPGRGLRVR